MQNCIKILPISLSVAMVMSKLPEYVKRFASKEYDKKYCS